MWERGDKTNQGITEINASSIGMAKVIAHTYTHTYKSNQLHWSFWILRVMLERGEWWEAGRRRRKQLLSAEREQRQNRCSSKKNVWQAGRCLVTATAFTLTFRGAGLSKRTQDRMEELNKDKNNQVKSFSCDVARLTNGGRVTFS